MEAQRVKKTGIFAVVLLLIGLLALSCARADDDDAQARLMEEAKQARLAVILDDEWTAGQTVAAELNYVDWLGGWGGLYAAVLTDGAQHTLHLLEFAQGEGCPLAAHTVLEGVLKPDELPVSIEMEREYEPFVVYASGDQLLLRCEDVGTWTLIDATWEK